MGLVTPEVTALSHSLSHGTYLVIGAAHLRWILQSYAAYYNQARTHRSLAKDCPVHRPIQAIGTIVSVPILGGLHHRYVRT